VLTQAMNKAFGAKLPRMIPAPILLRLRTELSNIGIGVNVRARDGSQQ
jgi:hypothetical protein